MSEGPQEPAGEAGVPAADAARELAADVAKMVLQEMEVGDGFYKHYLQVVFKEGRGGLNTVVRFLRASNAKGKMLFHVETEAVQVRRSYPPEPEPSNVHTLSDATLAGQRLFNPPKHNGYEVRVWLRSTQQEKSHLASPYGWINGGFNLKEFINICENEHVPSPAPMTVGLPYVRE